MSGLANYHEGHRRLQQRFDATALADRLEQVTYSRTLSDAQRVLIESAPMFFLATADAAGRPDCSFKGGAPGFVRVLGGSELAWPDYDGNGQFRSLGNLLQNAHAGLLFVDWRKPTRLRVNGTASMREEDELLESWPGAQLVVRLAIEQVFPNCPRYIPRMQIDEPSPYVPVAGADAPRPAWKDDPRFADAVPRRAPRG